MGDCAMTAQLLRVLASKASFAVQFGGLLGLIATWGLGYSLSPCPRSLAEYFRLRSLVKIYLSSDLSSIESEFDIRLRQKKLGRVHAI
jgi:hypothetical protein